MSQIGLVPFYRAVDANGNILPNARLYSFVSGTLTPQALYTDESLDTSHGAYVQADSGGLLANFYPDPVTVYRYQLMVSPYSAAVTGCDADPVTSLASSAVTFLQTGTGTVVQTAQRKMEEWKSLKDFGPCGNGDVTEDDTALGRAVAYLMSSRRATVINGGYAYPSSLIFVPPGDYKTTGGLGASLELLGFWALPNTVTITNTANTYLFDIPNRLDFTFLSGIRFIGGKGVLRHSFTGDNVSGDHVIEKCYFYDHTLAAISSDSANMPYWWIHDNFFYGKAASGTLTKGVAIGGLLDNSVIERNHFLRNDIHLQLGPLNSGNVQVLNNDFLSFEADRTDYDIWAIPSSLAQFGTGAGQATRFVGNKFGNEGIVDPTKKAPRMLVAAATGTNRATCTPDLTWKNGNDGTNWLVGLSFSTNRISSTNIDSNGGVDASFMDIYIEKMDRTYWASDNVVEDGYINYLFRHVDTGARVTDRSNTSWEVHIGSGLRTFDGALLRNGVSSHAIGPIHDPLGIAPSPMTLLPAGVRDPGETLLVEALTNAAWTVVTGVTKASATNPRDSRSTATDLTWSTAGVFASIALPDLTNYAGFLAWIAMDFQTIASAVDSLEYRIQNTFGGVDGQEQCRDFLKPPTGMTPILVPWTIPSHAHPYNFVFRLTAPSIIVGTKVRLGQTRIVVSRSAPTLHRSATIADATDAASAITQVNAVIAALKARMVIEP